MGFVYLKKALKDFGLWFDLWSKASLAKLSDNILTSKKKLMIR